MTVHKSWALRPTLAVLAILTMSACGTTTPLALGIPNIGKGSMCASCACCSKMSEKKQIIDSKKSACLCYGMMMGKDGCSCCGGDNGKPMICNLKSNQN